MKRSEQGFTLAEIIITLVVIALVLAVSYPSLSRATASLSLQTAGRDILSTLRYAREKAVTEQTGMRVLVDINEQTIRLTDDFGEGNRKYMMPENVRIQGVILGGSESTEDVTTVRFLPNGSSASVEILLEARNGAHLKVVSDPLSGGACIRTGSEEDVS
jgi:type II secretion system protein H